MLAGGSTRRREAVALTPVTDAAGLLAMRESLERVEISDDLIDYVIAIVTATRKGGKSRSAPAPAAASRWSSSPAARRCCTSATT